MANILLIGGCGYIGSRLFQVLNEEHAVDSVDIEWYGNFTSRFNIVKDFGQLTKEEVEYYDVVILLAGHSGKKYFGLRFGTVNGASPNLRNDIMINAMTYNALQNGKVFCFNPEVHRPILGIEDLCRAMKVIIEKGTHENSGLYNVASFNSTARQISEAVAKTTGAELEIVDTLPETITNVKLQTKAYNFLIDSTKFEEVFDFDFKETPTTIVQSIVEQFDNINKGNRSDAKLY